MQAWRFRPSPESIFLLLGLSLFLLEGLLSPRSTAEYDLTLLVAIFVWL